MVEVQRRVDINQQKEQFSNAYLQAVASVAGYSLYKPAVDDDSVDWGIAARGGTGRIRSPRLELQLKSTSRDVLDDSYVRYPLKLKNYDELRMDNFAIPRILVVVLLPENLADWIQQSEQELCIRYCAYWLSLRGMPQTQNTATVTVSLPRSNLFTVSALQSLMQLISQGSQP
ncbi:DUF4365 domain-containing protein [Aerosakkonema funiforme]|uniref:DUF4365 domain-containing protein n=1 Tax=Aerosakkonema funiforme TaxID=1246630 RepID=UPI002AC814AE|nr:DUF4365 domain-containing protein [Aerosakkonema funiforme]